MARSAVAAQTLDGLRSIAALLEYRGREAYALVANGDTVLAVNEFAFIGPRTTTEAAVRRESTVLGLEPPTLFVAGPQINATAAHLLPEAFKTYSTRDPAQKVNKTCQGVLARECQTAKFMHVDADARALGEDCLELGISLVVTVCHDTNCVAI